ncbi:MAG: Dabb family protein [Bacteroidales bacterium]|nr:Dabb family protein [Bacteroidales bacterium]
MIKHIVMFRIKGKDEGEKKARVQILNEMLGLLKSSVKEIIYLETGVNISTRNVAFDLVLVTHFKNNEDLQVYINHPEHQEVVKYLDTVRQDVAVVDYEY